jgi:hypothetical protein
MSNVTKLKNSDAYAKMAKLVESGRYSPDMMGYDRMRSDAHKYYGLQDHPKRTLLWLIAIHHGVSEGHMGILRWYDELSNLLT